MPRERIPEATEAFQRALFGPMDRHLRAVRERYGVRITARHEVVTIEGDDAAAVKDVAARARRVLARVGQIGDPPLAEVEDLLLGAEGGAQQRRGRSSGARGNGRPRAAPVSTALGSITQAKLLTDGQVRYVEAIRGNDVVFAIGPAGTGKTFLAVAEAVSALRSGVVRRIVLTRPAVEAGEKLGFLPGDFQAKINPYLRPLYDALGELAPWGEVQRFIDSDVIEIAPLAYMRGRTLKGAFIILDEAQNTTPMQMKMFLTRLGTGSKVVINGDVTQIDLPEGVTSGLVESSRILANVEGLSVVQLEKSDILRHALVQRIVDAYERHEAARALPSTPDDAAAQDAAAEDDENCQP